MTRTLTIAVAVLIVLPLPALAEDAPSLLYFSNQGPLVIRLRIEIDGKSHQQVWNEYVAGLFTSLDADGDGRLGPKEATGIPTPQQLQQAGLIAGGKTAPAPPADANPKDGKVSKEELADYLRRIGAAAFAVNQAPRSQVRRVVYGRRPAGDINLVEKLDRNGDGKLTAEEFALTADLRKLDLDDDETLSRAELQPLVSPFVGAVLASPSNAPTESPFVYLGDPGLSHTSLVRRLLDAYDNGGIPASKDVPGASDGRLSQKEMRLPAKTFAQFDADGDGRLDFDELRHFLRRPAAQVDVVVRIGSKEKSQRPVDIRSPADPRLADRIKPGKEAATLVLGKVQLEFSGQGPSVWVRDLLNFKQQFAALDRDNNGYLETKEVQGNSRLREAFKQIDRDGDAKVFQKEFVAYFERFAAAAKSRANLTISDAGNKLFDILDRNRDGRLTSRELAGGREKIAAWDENGDQAVGQGEIPRSWRLNVQRGSTNFGDRAVVVATTAPSSQTPRASAGPLWFAKMDRNGDGEVTRREFLGRLADFARIDVDKNGVIDPGEAGAVDTKR